VNSSASQIPKTIVPPRRMPAALQLAQRAGQLQARGRPRGRIHAAIRPGVVVIGEQHDLARHRGVGVGTRDAADDVADGPQLARDDQPHPQPCRAGPDVVGEGPTALPVAGGRTGPPSASRITRASLNDSGTVGIFGRISESASGIRLAPGTEGQPGVSGSPGR
jgi:hypothetical protein